MYWADLKLKNEGEREMAKIAKKKSKPSRKPAKRTASKRTVSKRSGIALRTAKRARPVARKAKARRKAA
jgi:hypothetical protein